MRLYGSPISTCTRKVLCTLAEKGAQHELIHIDILKGDQKRPDYLQAHQPFGVVPALDDDGFTMYESRAIMRYLDERLPGTKLTPADARGRARMEQWTSVEYSYFSAPTMRLVREKLFHPLRGLPVDAQNVAAARAELARTLDVLDQPLATQPYLAGQEFSLADIGFMPYIEYLYAAQESELITSRPQVAAWWGRVSARPSWQTLVRITDGVFAAARPPSH